MEETKKWEDLTDQEQVGVVHSHAAGLKISISTMIRIFQLGRPYVVIGENEGKPYCRIAAESVDVMKVIIREYGHE